MITHWENNFKNFVVKQYFNICFVLEDEEKFVEVEAAIKDNVEGGEDEFRSGWEQYS
jgi:hypothetical protein